MKKNQLLLVLFLILSLLLGSCLGIHDDVDEVLAPVESIEILVLESFPVQIHVEIIGYLPTPCYEITLIEQYREGNTFHVRVMMMDSEFSVLRSSNPIRRL
ncbi:MAG: hypothetical protein JW870_14845 [Candidatus Delongbacteria bacterium]|nr:hypothetical protein [Candidatus Delongbacteria bacterium]